MGGSRVQGQGRVRELALESGLRSALPCTPFKWESGEGVLNKAALLIPVTIAGKKHLFQLDTGTDVSLMKTTEAPRWGYKGGKDSFRVPNVRLGGLRLPGLRMWTREESRPDVSGTIGLQPLIGRVAVIDFVHSRFCLIPPEDFPPSLLEKIEWHPGMIRDGKFFVRVKVGGQELDGMFLDTGSSPFDLIVDRSDWQQLTGRTGEEDATSRLSAPSWGHSVTVIGAPALGDLEVGGIVVKTPLVYYVREQPTSFHESPYPAAGLVGNRPFFDRIVVLALGERPMIGTLTAGEHP
jgi:hypothetical protein